MSPLMKRNEVILTHARNMRWRGKYYGFGASKEDWGDCNKFSFRGEDLTWLSTIFKEAGHPYPWETSIC